MNKIIVVICSILCSISMYAQSSENLPYSRYGLGTLSSDNLYHLRTMGSIGTSFNSPYFVNIANPASYSKLMATAFDVGVYAQGTKLSTASTSHSAWSGNLEYFALALPLYNPLNRILDREEKDYTFGFALALKPYSNVFYDIAVQDSLSDVGRVQRRYKGNGNVNEFLTGLSGSYKSFSAGVNVKYVFGNIDFSRATRLADQPKAYENSFVSNYNLNGFAFQGGVQYGLDISEKDKEGKVVKSRKINFGITYTGASSVKTSSDFLNVALQPVAGSRTPTVDTLSSGRDISGSGTLPAKLGIGINYTEGYKFLIGLDYENSLWSQYENTATGAKAGSLKNAYKVSLGGHYRPDYKSYSSFFKRVAYRYGFLYEKDGRIVDGKQLDRMAVTFGLGLPFNFQRKISNANIGVELGLRGRNTPIKEEYIKFTLSFNFSDDEWFLKSRYN